MARFAALGLGNGRRYMKKEKKIGIGAISNGLMIFVVACGVLLAIGCGYTFTFDTKAGLVVLAITLLYLAGCAVLFFVVRKKAIGVLVNYARSYQTMESEFIDDFPLPFVVALPDGTILLYNKRFGRFFEGEPETGNICEVFKSLAASDLDSKDAEWDIKTVYDKRSYRLHFGKLPVNDELFSSGVLTAKADIPYVLTVQLFDETEIVNMMIRSAEQQMVVGILQIDNYVEMISSLDDVEQSLTAALVDKAVGSYFDSVGGLVRKTEKDRYFIVFKRKCLPAMQRARFDLLDMIKEIDTGSEIPVTISMGVGVGEDYVKDYSYARDALELALGRGGDQVVLKDGERVYFYGGKTKTVEKNTRVKARINALALKDIISHKDNVVIMGHKTGDMDSFASAVGVLKVAKMLGKKGYIVLDELSNAIRPVLEGFLDDPDYGEETFLPVAEAPGYVNDKTALVIVDVNKTDIFECKDLIYKTSTIVLIDHHLQSGDKIDNVALSYVEPNASSASEMITELLQYISGDVRLTKREAETLYAGILIDTDRFTKNTGVRTFEAAAYLRKSGADVSKVNGLFKDTLEDVLIKADSLRTAETIADGYVMVVCPAEGDNPNILAAQVANELLDIKGIRGSFALTEYNNMIYISARSSGDVNVQLVMERMGGGGHLNIAGTQMAGTTIEEAQRKLKMTVRKMIEEGILQ